MAENVDKQIAHLSEGLSENERLLAQINAVINLLVDKRMVTSEEYFEEFVESLKEAHEIKKNETSF